MNKDIREKRVELHKKECKCLNCANKCREYYNNSTSDKAYYEWAMKEENCELKAK